MITKSILIISIMSVLHMGKTVSGQSEQCNSCCQGPSGNPGVPGNNGSPGIPGNNGINGVPGRDGLKGETGIGLKGEPGIGLKGEPGFGLKGDSGDLGLPGPRGPQSLQGLPGKVGPRGRDGAPGVIGQPGPVGEKGFKGEAQVTRQSAFSVIKTGSQVLQHNQPLVFNIIETNIGNHYDSSSNKFTCQIPGTYYFTYTIASYNYNHDPYVSLVRDDSPVATILIRDGDTTTDFNMAAQSIVLQLDTGNQVWLRGGSGTTVYSDTNKYTTFSGFLLYS